MVAYGQLIEHKLHILCIGITVYNKSPPPHSTITAFSFSLLSIPTLYFAPALTTWNQYTGLGPVEMALPTVFVYMLLLHISIFRE